MAPFSQFQPSKSAGAFELVQLKNGHFSIRSRAHGETMHVDAGPGPEAHRLHIQQQRLVERVQAQTCNLAMGSAISAEVSLSALPTKENRAPFVIWDVGLGAAGNALAALSALKALPTLETPVELHSFESDTELLAFALQHAPALGYLTGWEAPLHRLLTHSEAYPLPHVHWWLHRGDYRAALHLAPAPDAIFHDPYSPARNPEMWSLELFRGVRQAAGDKECLLTNYTRSTAVRVTLALAGWAIGQGASTGEKDQTTIAATRLELLEHPFGTRWLHRVRASVNAAPVTGTLQSTGPHGPGVLKTGPISEEDWAKLKALPQFSAALG